MSGSDLSSEDLAADPTWVTMMNKPVTRGELIYALQNVQVALLGQAITDATIVAGASEKQTEEAVQRSIDSTNNVLGVIRTLIDTWRGGE